MFNPQHELLKLSAELAGVNVEGITVAGVIEAYAKQNLEATFKAAYEGQTYRLAIFASADGSGFSAKVSVSRGLAGLGDHWWIDLTTRYEGDLVHRVRSSLRDIAGEIRNRYKSHAADGVQR